MDAENWFNNLKRIILKLRPGDQNKAQTKETDSKDRKWQNSTTLTSWRERCRSCAFAGTRSTMRWCNRGCRAVSWRSKSCSSNAKSSASNSILTLRMAKWRSTICLSSRATMPLIKWYQALRSSPKHSARRSITTSENLDGKWSSPLKCPCNRI